MMLMNIVVNQAIEAIVRMGDNFYLSLLIKGFTCPADLPPHEVGQLIVL
jgi:hypothetical protein